MPRAWTSRSVPSSELGLEEVLMDAREWPPGHEAVGKRVPVDAEDIARHALDARHAQQRTQLAPQQELPEQIARQDVALGEVLDDPVVVADPDPPERGLRPAAATEQLALAAVQLGSTKRRGRRRHAGIGKEAGTRGTHGGREFLRWLDDHPGMGRPERAVGRGYGFE